MEKVLKTIRKAAGTILICCSFPLLASDGLTGGAIAVAGLCVGYFLVKPYIPEE